VTNSFSEVGVVTPDLNIDFLVRIHNGVDHVLELPFRSSASSNAHIRPPFLKANSNQNLGVHSLEVKSISVVLEMGLNQMKFQLGSDNSFGNELLFLVILFGSRGKST
jgi:hypothetical protein